MRSSSTTRSYNSSSSTWRRGLLAVKAHPAVTGHMTRRSCSTARPLHSRRVSPVRESMQKTAGCQFLPHHEPRLGGIRSAAASTGKHTVHVIDRICASEKTTVDTLWMNWYGMERAKRSGRIRQSLAGRPGMADLEWIGSSHYLYSVSRSASRSLFMLLELETAGRHVCRISGRWSSVLATHGRNASTYKPARLRRMVRATHARACMHAPTATHRTTQTQTTISNERT
jgi:hypothetical protein